MALAIYPLAISSVTEKYFKIRATDEDDIVKLLNVLDGYDNLNIKDIVDIGGATTYYIYISNRDNPQAIYLAIQSALQGEE